MNEKDFLQALVHPITCTELSLDEMLATIPEGDPQALQERLKEIMNELERVRSLMHKRRNEIKDK